MPQPAIARGRMPAHAVRVTLPATEACMHLKIACQQRWVAKVGENEAAIYDENGHPYGPPVLLCEAGLDADGQPKPLHEPTGTAVQIPDPGDPTSVIRVVIPDPPAGSHPLETVSEQPTVKLTLAQLLERSTDSHTTAPGDPTLPVARLLAPLATVTKTGGLRATSILPDAPRLSIELAQAGWCCVLNIDGDVVELVARRRAPTIADVVEELLALRGSGTVYLDNADQTDTLATAELLVCAHSDDSGPADQ